jgi:hypothetical protein
MYIPRSATIPCAFWRRSALGSGNPPTPNARFTVDLRPLLYMTFNHPILQIQIRWRMNPTHVCGDPDTRRQSHTLSYFPALSLSLSLGVSLTESVKSAVFDQATRLVITNSNLLVLDKTTVGSGGRDETSRPLDDGTMPPHVRRPRRSISYCTGSDRGLGRRQLPYRDCVFGG